MRLIRFGVPWLDAWFSASLAYNKAKTGKNAVASANSQDGGIKADPGASPVAKGEVVGAVTPAANLLEQPEGMDVEGSAGVPAVTPASAPVA